MTLLDLITLVCDRGGGIGMLLAVVLAYRLKVTVTWTRTDGLKLTVRL